MTRADLRPAPSPDQPATIEAGAAPVRTVHGAAPAARLLNSDQLFAGATEVQIEHRGALYRLKQTALGKLILTK